MKKLLLLVGIMLIALPVVAQEATLGVYFDADGTSNTFAYQPYVDAGVGKAFDAYVIGYAEALVGGAAYTLAFPGDIILLNAEYPVGTQFGTPTGGIEVGLTNPVVGYYAQPTLFSTLHFMFLTVGNILEIEMLPHWRYDTVMLAEGGGPLIPATNVNAMITPTVDGETESWGQVKSLFQ